MFTRRGCHKSLTTEIVKDKTQPVRKTHHKKQTTSNEENSEFDAEHIQAPVFNIHIHVPPFDGNNPTMMLPRIQPVIHIHFDELAKKLDVKNAVEKSSTYREVQNKFIRSPAKFSNITFHYNGNLTTSDGSDSNQEDCSTDQLTSKKKRNSKLDDESGSGTPCSSKTDCLRKKILRSDVNNKHCDRIFSLESSKDNPKCYSDLIKKYKIKESYVMLTDFVKTALKHKNSGKKSHETNINLRNNTIKEEHDYVIREPMHPQNFDKTCHVSGFADTDNDINVNEVCSELGDIVTEEDYVADTSDSDDENDELTGSINPCEINKVKQRVDDLEHDVKKNNDNLNSALSTQFNSKEGNTKNVQVSNNNENSQFRTKSLSPELNLLSVSRKSGGIYSEVYGSEPEEPTSSNNITVMAEKCNFSEILKNFKAEVRYRSRVLKTYAKKSSNTNPGSPAVNNEEQICQKESDSRENMCSKKDSTYTFSIGSESDETQTTLNLRLGVTSENKIEPNANSFFVQKVNTPCRLKVIETHRLIDQTLFENSPRICELSTEFFKNQSSVENLQDNKRKTQAEDTVDKQELISTETGILENKDMDSNRTYSSEAKLMNPKNEKKMVNGNVTRTPSSSSLKNEQSPTKKRQLEVKNSRDNSSSALKKMKSSQNQTQITSSGKCSKASSTEGDYIPLKVSGPTKFAVAALDQLSSPLGHDARNFRNKMLYGNRVNRFSSSNELQLYKMKQMASRGASHQQ